MTAFQNAKDEAGEGQARSHLGKILLLDDRLPEAQRSCEQAMSLGVKLEDKLNEADAKGCLGLVLAKMDRVMEAIVLLESAVNVFGRAGITDTEVQWYSRELANLESKRKR